VEKTHSLPVHADTARDQVGIQGESVTVALFDASDLAAPLQLREHLLQFPLLIAREPQLRPQLGGVERPYNSAAVADSRF